MKERLIHLDCGCVLRIFGARPRVKRMYCPDCDRKVTWS
jgi:hypothetical protein